MEELDYISSSPDLQPVQRKVKSQDESDLTTLQRVSARLDKYIAHHRSVDALTADEAQFPVRIQLVLNQRSVLLAEELRLLIDTTVNDVKEKYNNG